MSSPTAFSFLQADNQFSNIDYEQLKTDPKRLISILLSKKNSRKFLSLLEKASLFHPKRKSSKTRSIYEQLSKLNITEVLPILILSPEPITKAIEKIRRQKGHFTKSEECFRQEADALRECGLFLQRGGRYFDDSSIY